jgi:hypothetical protein
VPDFGVEALGKLQNLRGDGLAAVRERGWPDFLGAVVQLGVLLAFPEGEQEREGECEQEKAGHPGGASGCMLYTHIPQKRVGILGLATPCGKQAENKDGQW